LDNLLALRRSAFVATTDSDHELLVHLNLAGRMQLSRINQLWVADITFVKLQQEFVYLAVILDAFSRKVVGWALDRTLAAQLAITALQNAIASRTPHPGLVHHSDRGIQYASAEYGKVLDNHQIIASMSRLANPWDNAKCESFMKTLKLEEIHANEYRGIEDLRKNVSTFVDVYYNTQRLHSALDTTRRNILRQGSSELLLREMRRRVFLGIRRSINPMERTKRGRQQAASRIIVLMSLRLAIPRLVGLHQSQVPLHQPHSS
jgi:putative transposase